MMPANCRAALRPLRRRWLLALLLREAVSPAAAALVLAGLAVLAVRLFAPSLNPRLHYLALLALPAIAVAVARAVRRWPRQADLLAMADSRLQAHGLLLTAAEADVGGWNASLAEAALAKMPLPAWRLRWAAARVLPCLAFFALATLTPLRTPTRHADLPWRRAVEDLRSRAEALAEAELLDEQSHERIREAIGEFEAARHENPLSAAESSWEAVDALREAVEQRLQEAAEAARMGREAAALAAELAEASAAEQAAGSEGSEAGSRALDEAGRRLAEALQRVGAEGLPADLLERLGGIEALREGQPALPADAAAMAELARELQAALQERCEAFAMAGLPCDGQGGEGAGVALGEGDDGLLAALGDGWNPVPGPDGDGQPGRGGITRGGGPSAMTWGDESRREGVQFRQEVLPEGVIVNLDGLVVDTRPVAQEPDAERGEAGPARDFGATPGMPAWRQGLAPRHRHAVRRYFAEE